MYIIYAAILTDSFEFTVNNGGIFTNKRHL